jgi:hypothetical protein
VTDLLDDIPSHDEIAGRLRGIPPEVQDEAAGIWLSTTGQYVWTPNRGPQSDAYDCLADELFYGGQAGGGKTALGLGLALTAHKRSPPPAPHQQGCTQTGRAGRGNPGQPRRLQRSTAAVEILLQ